MKYLVKLTYFKESGKFYLEGRFLTEESKIHKIWDEVRELRNAGRLPGLIGGSHRYIVLVNVPDHPLDHPALITLE